MWRKTETRPVRGVLIKGQSYAPKSRLWYKFWLARVLVQFFLGKVIFFLEVHTRDPYVLGYKTEDGTTWIYSKPFCSGVDKKKHNILMVRVRREDCRYFAINMSGHGLPVSIKTDANIYDLKNTNIHIV